VELQTFLRSMGADVSGAGEDVITIRGGGKLHGGAYTVEGDRIAAATYLCAAAAAGGEVEVSGVEPLRLRAVLSCLEQAGCEIRCGERGVLLRGSGCLRGIAPVRTAPYPGFPTDAQAILMAALAGGRGTTMFVETIFDSRYGHVDELRRMGADINTHGRVAVVTGTGRLHGARVRSTDLRGGAALAVAALGAEGTTQLLDLSHIRRGYDGLDRDLLALGAHIRATE
jgi:UDP-N-acetylglucosamine 1-carboxyvinyltransferase